MAVFRKIHTSFWQDPLVLDLTPEEKYFYLYLMTNTKTNQCGIYEIPKKVMEMETGYNRETIDKLIKRFVEYERILFSQSTNEIMLVNWIKYNGSASPKVLSRVKDELLEIKNKDFVKKYINLSNGYNYTLDTVSIEYIYSMDTKSQEEEEEEQEEEQEEEYCPEQKLEPGNNIKIIKEVDLGNPVIKLSLNDKSEYPIYQKQLEEWKQLYPAVDILQELRKMKGWLDANPKRRKTKTGVLKFVNGWLSREQDKGGIYRNQNGGKQKTKSYTPKISPERLKAYEEMDVPFAEDLWPDLGVKEEK